MADEIIFRQCLEDDIESVLELWRAAESTASVTDTSQDLLRTINSGASSVILADSGGNIVGSIIASFDGWRGMSTAWRCTPITAGGGSPGVWSRKRKRGFWVKAPSAWARWWSKTTLGPPVSGTPPSSS